MRLGVKALREEWFSTRGNHLQGVLDHRIEDHMPAEVAEYLRDVAKEGVKSRFRGQRRRQRAKPHNSLLEHLEGFAEKAVEDTA